ncbi:MAG: hypothetical protein LBT48_08800, partial [Prevotellaceae bacterium]|nr:hypothetical protein [Prevotellaceae bacterium]
IEEHTHGALDIEITIEVLRDTVTSLHGGEGPKMSVAERTRIQPETFDSQIFTADYTGISTNGWRAVTYPNCMYSIIPFMHTTNSGWSYEANTAETKQYQRNLYVHEWCHQVEWYFPSIVDGKYAMPTLHDNGGAQYNYNNTGLNGEAGLAKWYADFVGGTIEMYPNANNVNQGVYAGWWQFNPLKQGYTQRWYENE